MQHSNVFIFFPFTLDPLSLWRALKFSFFGCNGNIFLFFSFVSIESFLVLCCASTFVVLETQSNISTTKRLLKRERKMTETKYRNFFSSSSFFRLVPFLLILFWKGDDENFFTFRDIFASNKNDTKRTKIKAPEMKRHESKEWKIIKCERNEMAKKRGHTEWWMQKIYA